MKINLNDNYLYYIEGCRKRDFASLVVDLIKNNNFKFNDFSVFTNHVKFSNSDFEDVFNFSDKTKKLVIQDNKNIPERHYITNFMMKQRDSLSIIYSNDIIIEELQAYHSLLELSNNKIIVVDYKFSEIIKNIKSSLLIYPKIIKERLSYF